MAQRTLYSSGAKREQVRSKRGGDIQHLQQRQLSGRATFRESTLFVVMMFMSALATVVHALGG